MFRSCSTYVRRLFSLLLFACRECTLVHFDTSLHSTKLPKHPNVLTKKTNRRAMQQQERAHLLSAVFKRSPLQRTPRTRTVRRHAEVTHLWHLRTLKRVRYASLSCPWCKTSCERWRTFQRLDCWNLIVSTAGDIVHLLVLLFLFNQVILHVFYVCF
jgi:hypothetical protein